MRWLVSWPLVWGIVVLVLLMAWAVIETILDTLTSAWRRRRRAQRRHTQQRDAPVLRESAVDHVLRESHDAAIDRLVRDIDADYEQRMGGRR